MDRASGVLILNSPSTGIPEAILEASVISAKRTAASAALAAMSLVGSQPYRCLGLVGCGYINHEICRFVLKVSPEIQKIVMYDTDDSVAHCVAPAYRKMAGRAQVQCADTLAEVLGACDLISFASTAAQPYLMHLEGCAPGCTILHISLRDLGCEAILSADNLVDDPDHVCRADTSIHLTEQQTGNRAFIRGTLADVLTGRIVARSHAESRTVFSPFGLGMLDLAVGDLVLLYARQKGFTTNIPSFLPDPWRLSLSSQLYQ
jgi:2,3-diaminopropionate biosynthesis protein SbnB